MPTVTLIDGYADGAASTLFWNLLVERPAAANISHKTMPTWQMHLDFIASRPYPHWYAVKALDGPGALALFGYIGAIYLTKADEIGIAILKVYQHLGYAAAALAELKRLHPRPRYLANVAPANLESQQFFLQQGFKALQVTYELTP